MDDSQAGVASSSGAAGEAEEQVPFHGPSQGQPEQQGHEQQQQQQQQQQQAQQLVPTIAGARNYGYPDDFMMYAFKVEVCSRTDKHPRGSCPHAHPGDVARRRHPSRYQALLCPEVRAKKVCPRLEECQCSHSAFEFWLHPDRYRTSMCEKGVRCSRPVCFFAHTAEELRPLPAGLKAATPEDASGGGTATSSSSKHRGGTWQPPGGSTPGQQHPAYPPGGLSGGVHYVQQQAAQPQQQVLLQPELQQVQRGAAPVLVMPAGPQQQQYALQQAAVQEQAQLPEVMQQFQGMLVSPVSMTPQQQQQYAQFSPAAPAPPAGQWQHAGGHQQQGSEQLQQTVVVMQQGGSQAQIPYLMQQPQMMYVQGLVEHTSWPQSSQQQQQQQQQQQYMYGAGYTSAAAASSSGGGGYQWHQQLAAPAGCDGAAAVDAGALGAAGSMPAFRALLLLLCTNLVASQLPETLPQAPPGRF
ncbi:hypothetical protein COO60DRAFT_1657117 [Scenedesmus sp. NREL 46B-D3]|nr:hypothetical protein COO60DRAFT_1657117 [Scenedesmus sp. NREL 46B-D3]